MSSKVHVVVIITPAPGKEARLKKLLIDLTVKVKELEPDVLKYQAFEQYNGEGGNKFVVDEIYKDQATFDALHKTDYFQALGKQMAEESLLGGPLDVKTIEPIGGFASR